MVRLTAKVARFDPLIEDAGVSRIQIDAWLMQFRKQGGGRFDEDLFSVCLPFDNVSHLWVLL